MVHFHLEIGSSCTRAWSGRLVNLSAAARAALMNMISKCSNSSAVYLNRLGHLTVGMNGTFPIFTYEQTFFALNAKVRNKFLLAFILSICKYSEDNHWHGISFYGA